MILDFVICHWFSYSFHPKGNYSVIRKILESSFLSFENNKDQKDNVNLYTPNLIVTISEKKVMNS